MEAKVPGIIITYQPMLNSWKTAKITHKMSNEENIKSVKEVVWESWASKEELWLRGWWNGGLEAEEM